MPTRFAVHIVLACLFALQVSCTYYERIVVRPRGDAAVDGDGSSFDVICPPGQVACNGNCEVTSISPEHCGACGHACSNAGGTGVCASGSCRILCDSTHFDCDHDPANGCESALAEPGNCGTCGRVCTAGLNETSICQAGACASTCSPGYADCDGNAGTGCETHVDQDPANCGHCGLVCTLPNADAMCVAGTCRIGTCRTGFGDCDGDPSNGCETNTATSPSHCGACGRSCSGATVCSAGTCTTGCPLTTCDSLCVDTSNDVNNCGSCGRVCPSGAGAVPTCSGGNCDVDCVSGTGNCDGDPTNGCETATAFDPAHCGVCSTTCPSVSNGTATCSSGLCGSVCNPGYADCNRDGSCETALQTSTTNCGSCGMACPSGQSCVDGHCACGAGLTPCGGACVNLSSDNSSCGACGAGCAAGTYCVSGSCQATCMAPSLMCGTNCIDPLSDVQNCGSCGNPCSAGMECVNGSCGCPSGQTLCNLACVDLRTNAYNCGACDNPCPAGASCMGGTCVCPSPATLCNGSCTSLLSSPYNCGSCGRPCGYRQYCNMGMCMSF